MMDTQPRNTSPLLLPYLKLAFHEDRRLVLLTSVLGASVNWLILQFLLSTLAEAPISETCSPNGDSRHGTIVFLSFQRDITFWSLLASKLGVDLTSAGSNGRFIFIDGLGMFADVDSGHTATTCSERYMRLKRAPAGSSCLGHIENEVLRACITARTRSKSPEGKNSTVMLLVDGLDFILAATESDSSAVEDTLRSWRKEFNSVVLHLVADRPFLHAQHSPLEIQQACFLLGVAHSADLTMACTTLDTGGASDVAGIIRISPHAGSNWGTAVEGSQLTSCSKELLYYVNSNCHVKIFERGA